MQELRDCLRVFLKESLQGFRNGNFGQVPSHLHSGISVKDRTVTQGRRHKGPCKCMARPFISTTRNDKIKEWRWGKVGSPFTVSPMIVLMFILKDFLITTASIHCKQFKYLLSLPDLIPDSALAEKFEIVWKAICG